MGRLAAFVAAAFVVVQCSQLITATSFESWNNNGDQYWTNQGNPWYDSSIYHSPNGNQYSNYWDDFNKRMMDIDQMVNNIMQDINQPIAMEKNFNENFQNKIQNSIESNLKESLGNAEKLQKKIMMETEEMQKKTSKEQSKMIDGRDGVTLLEIEGDSKPKIQYVIRDSKWYKCKDNLSTSEAPSCTSDLVECQPDVCAFNSIVKYNVNRDPVKPIYKDDNVVCLIKGSSNSVRQFSGVNENMVKETCVKGDVLTLKEYNDQCGVKVKLGYYYWPKDAKLCKLIINWKVSSNGISQSTSSGQGNSDNDAFSVVSSSVSNISKK